MISNDNVATFIKELVLKLPEGEVDFRAGGYRPVWYSPYDMKYTDIDVAEEYQGDWIKFGVFDTVSSRWMSPRSEPIQWRITRKRRHHEVQYPA